jgi:hypothetical protein
MLRDVAWVATYRSLQGHGIASGDRSRRGRIKRQDGKRHNRQRGVTLWAGSNEQGCEREDLIQAQRSIKRLGEGFLVNRGPDV